MRKTVHTFEYKQLLRRLRDARLQAGLTQIEAAEKLRKNQSFVSKVESGERRIDVLELWEMSKAYGVGLDLMLSDILPERKP